MSVNDSNNYRQPSPRQDYERTIDDEAYQSRVRNYEPANNNYYQTQKRTVVEVSGNFQMSKSECEQFLERVREQMRI